MFARLHFATTYVPRLQVSNCDPCALRDLSSKKKNIQTAILLLLFNRFFETESEMGGVIHTYIDCGTRVACLRMTTSSKNIS